MNELREVPVKINMTLYVVDITIFLFYSKQIRCDDFVLIYNGKPFPYKALGNLNRSAKLENLNF